MIAPVRPGEERLLADLLNAFGNDITGRRTPPDDPRIDFPACPALHFARLALLPDPDRGAGRSRLLFATDYDGSLADHVQEILEHTRHPDQIWGRLEGYRGPAQFADFVRAHLVPPDAYYKAFPDTTLDAAREALAVEAAFNARLAEPEPARDQPALPELLRLARVARAAWRLVREPLAGVGRAIRAGADVFALMFQLGIRPVLEAALRINATLNRVWWIRPFNVLLRNRPAPRPHPFTQADPRWRAQPTPPGYPPEDSVLQNQLTLVTEVAPGEAPRLAAVLALIDLYGRRLSPPGSLVGISTIHTVRWALIDDRHRLLMVSNYDSTWENYIDEFAEMILSGLDALWRSAPDYPIAGAQDLAALKQFLRWHQVPANAFYSALPDTSVLNLQQALEFAAWLGPIVARRAAAPIQPAA